MPATKQMRDVPYAPAEMFALVADIETYPDFLPWCANARITSRENKDGMEIVVADLIAAYGMLREKFTSRVELDAKAKIIDVNYVKGPFKYLVNKWEFEALPDGGTRIHFFIDFEFRNLMLQSLMHAFFDKAFAKMMDAFISRADELYGK